MGLDAGIADKVVAVLRELANMLRRGEDEIHVTNIDRRAQGSEHRIGHGEAFAIVEQEPTIGGIKFIGELSGLLELGQTVGLRQAAPDSLTLGKARKPLER